MKKITCRGWSKRTGLLLLVGIILLAWIGFSIWKGVSHTLAKIQQSDIYQTAQQQYDTVLAPMEAVLNVSQIIMETEFSLEEVKEGIITIGKREGETTGEGEADLHRFISVGNLSETTCDFSSCRSAYFEYTGSCEPTKEDGCSFQLQALDNNYVVTVQREKEGQWKKVCRYQKGNEKGKEICTRLGEEDFQRQEVE